jgi:hypothetical protein
MPYAHFNLQSKISIINPTILPLGTLLDIAIERIGRGWLESFQ